MTSWRARDIPDLTGRRAIVTGGNSGLGFATSLELAKHGAGVVLTSRDPGRGADAVSRIRAAVPDADVSSRQLDLADLESVRTFADHNGAPIDILVNNAGVMAVPPRATVDGFELQLGTNHLGHFALTGLLLPALLERPEARIVTVSSMVHRTGTIDFADLMSEGSYSPWRAYAQSKLANLLFMRELDRRLREARCDVLSVGAHPGFASTNLQTVGPQMSGRRISGLITKLGTVALAQSAAMGALPQLYAATAPGVEGGDYFGPRGLGQQRGLPTKVSMSGAARDDVVALRLWDVSAQLTHVQFTALQLRIRDLRRPDSPRS